jgi:hypothetical protein
MIMMMHRTENDKCQDLYTAENATEQYAVTQLRNTLTIEGDVYWPEIATSFDVSLLLL